MSTTKNIIRTIYLYLFALVGLVLTVIGAVIIVNNVLKTYVFKTADFNYNQQPYISQPVTMDPVVLKNFDTITALSKLPVEDSKDTTTTTDSKDDKTKTTPSSSATVPTITADEKVALDAWLDDYKKWSDSEKQRMAIEAKRDYAKENRDRAMANALSMIIVGFPIYLIHWFMIVRDIRRNKVNEI